MSDRPIIFSGPMVRALLAGRKTQTRRLSTSPLRRCAVGDRLYVRESHRFRGALYDGDHEEEWFRIHSANGPSDNWDPVFPTGWEPSRHAGARVSEILGNERVLTTRLLPSIHMPRWASRLTLIVEGVRIEPLQAISEADAVAEGLRWRDVLQAWQAVDSDSWPCWTDPRRSYAGLWNDLHTPGERWEDNPDVLVLTFRVEHGNIDHVARTSRDDRRGG